MPNQTSNFRLYTHSCGAVLSKVLEENGGKWGLGGVLSKVLEENGENSGKLGTNGGRGVY